MTTLTDFLRARLAEDEAAARAGLGPSITPLGDDAADEVIAMAYNEGVAVEGIHHYERHAPSRLLADVDAKRRLLALYEAEQPRADAMHRDAVDRADAYLDAIELAAMPYADHPDYRKEWRAQD